MTSAMLQNTKKQAVPRKKPTKRKKPRGKSASVIINYLREEFFQFKHLPPKAVKVPKAAKKR
jgi:hypothetical protein